MWGGSADRGSQNNAHSMLPIFQHDFKEEQALTSNDLHEGDKGQRPNFCSGLHLLWRGKYMTLMDS